MIRQEEISLVIDAQREAFLRREAGLERQALRQLPIADAFATIITGIRRCGKSTLLLQLLRKHYQQAVYLNFDDIRLAGFHTDDLPRLHREVTRRGIDVLFFDEIQLVAGWEQYVSQLLRDGYKVFVTGSNAAMLSIELGTHLTGRHLSMELFPFSYAEFLAFKGLDRDPASLMEYLQTGGVPEYVKHGIPQILQSLADDILVRDIAVRHAVRDVNTLRQLTAFLITHIGNLMSASKLVGMFDIKSPATFLEYFSFLKGAYLLDFMPMFSHSLKVQARNPKKVYVMDMGLYTQLAISTTENMGRRLENLVFLHLRRSHQQLFYHKDRGECDFLVLERGVVRHAIQVCARLTDENFEREFQGLWDAMSHFDLQQGTIVTLEQTDSFVRDGRHVEVVPAHIFMG